MPVEAARKLGGVKFAAGQGHGLENPLVAECRFLIGLFRREVTILCDVLVRVPVPFSHRIMSFRNPDRRVQLMKARLRATSLPKRTTKNRYSRLSLLVHAGTSQDKRHQRANDWKVREHRRGRSWAQLAGLGNGAVRRFRRSHGALLRLHQPCLPAILLFISGGLPGSC